MKKVIHAVPKGEIMLKKIGIIGAGIIGTSLAYHLTKHEGVDVIVFEKNQIGSGTTAKSAGTLCLIDDSLPFEFFEQRVTCLKTYKEMNEKTHGESEFVQSGTLVVSPTEEEIKRAKLHVEASQKAGYNAEFVANPDDLVKYLPDLTPEGVLGGAWTPDDGYNNPTAAALIYARWAREQGAKFITHANVNEILKSNGAVSGIKSSKGDFDFDIVICAAGPWSNKVGTLVDLELPLVHTKAEVFILKTDDPLNYEFPILKYPNWYARSEGRAVFVCKSHMAMDYGKAIETGVWDPDELPLSGGTEEYFFDFLTERLAESVPNLLDAQLVNDWLGYRSVTMDKLPIVGETDVEGFLVATGMSGNGVILAPDTGRILTNFLVKDEWDPLLDKFKPSRFK
jgi:glycine/D-amino acid oxidase-like deaminating enzyme